MILSLFVRPVRRWCAAGLLAGLLLALAALLNPEPSVRMELMDQIVIEPLDASHGATIEGLTAREDGLALTPDHPRGIYLSPLRAAPFAFDEMVATWNARASAGGRLIVEARVGTSRTMSGWLCIANWNDPVAQAEPTTQGDTQARLVADTVTTHAATYYQLRVTIEAGPTRMAPVLSLLAATLSGSLPEATTGSIRVPAPAADWPPGPTDAQDGKRGEERSARGVTLDVPFRSQTWEAADIRHRICAPTSLAMVLEYLGTRLPTAQVAQACYDRRNDIYGNWSLDAAFAGTLGYQALVARARALEPVEREIARGRPVILSLRFDRGELTGAPVEQSAGHLLVVRGFTREGDVVVNDPAGASAAQGQRVYRRDEVLRAWKSGAAILVRPRS